MKPQPLNRHQRVWLALLVAFLAALAAPLAARHAATANQEPVKIAVNWSSRMPRP